MSLIWHEENSLLSKEAPATHIAHFSQEFWRYTTSIYLFTASDWKTILLPKTCFGLACAFSGSNLATDATPDLYILGRIPLIMLWIWSNLLPFNISNQRQPLSIAEDNTNKSWRPMPSGAISQSEAKVLMICFYCFAIWMSFQLGNLAPCLSLMVLGWIYNDLGGADHSCIIRNMINGAGYMSFALGATNVALSPEVRLNHDAHGWFVLLATIIFGTVQMQDIPDQEGDLERGRRTVPLVIGDIPARATVILGCMLGSLVAPRYWDLPWSAYLAPSVLAAVIATRLMQRQKLVEDKKTFKLWNVWVVSIYILPLMKKIPLA